MFDTVAKLGCLVMVHAENGDIVLDNERRMMAAGVSGPEGHAMAHPPEAEVGEQNRNITNNTLVTLHNVPRWRP